MDVDDKIANTSLELYPEYLSSKKLKSPIRIYKKVRQAYAKWGLDLDINTVGKATFADISCMCTIVGTVVMATGERKLNSTLEELLDSVLDNNYLTGLRSEQQIRDILNG